MNASDAILNLTSRCSSIRRRNSLWLLTLPVIRSQIQAAAAAAKVDARLVMDFMRISGRGRAMESAGNPQRRAVPERDRLGWLPGIPEEPST